MCIIAYKPQNVTIAPKTLETCFENNPDGAGFMFPHENQLVIEKGFFTYKRFAEAWDKAQHHHGDKLPVVFHFRIATAGRIDKANCHPHRIARDLGFVHNGMLSCVKVPKSSRFSDTLCYRDRYLWKMTARSLYDKRLLKALGRHIGEGNKLAQVTQLIF